MKTDPSSLRGITEVCLYATNLEAAEDFYANTLGLELITSSEAFRFFRVDNQVLLIFNPDISEHQQDPPPHFARGNQHIAFLSNAENYTRWKARLKEASVAIDQEITWPKNGLRSFYFKDPEGNVLEILEGNIWQ